MNGRRSLAGGGFMVRLAFRVISFATLADPYFTGDVVYLTIFGTSMLVVSSAQAAVDLMDKRSAIYSDRPRFPLVDL